jgi:hypothetical protein
MSLDELLKAPASNSSTRMAEGLGCALKSVLDQNQPGDSHWPQRRKMILNRFRRMRSVGAYLGPTTRHSGREPLAQASRRQAGTSPGRECGWRTRAGRCGRRIWRGSPVDTTVQPKDITFPTDAKLLDAAIEGLTRKRVVRLQAAPNVCSRKPHRSSAPTSPTRVSYR